MKFKVAHDISVLLGVEDTTYPGDAPYRRENISSTAQGAYNLSSLILSAHAGTHIDAPAHMLDRARTIDQYPVEDFILPAHVVPVDDRESIKPKSLDGLKIRSGEALLFKTHNSISGLSRGGKLSDSFVYMSAEAADLCISLEARLVGIDYISVDRIEDESAPVHHRLLKNDVLILEGIDLGNVLPGRYTLFCPPLKIKDGEASPVRAMLMQ